ncbi:hypothetical protein [Henriciella aquimarina]|uniref:hypothetical protein n=1 Tax=Henriciella aquimarina TaxID=545261 RepID=UPI0009FD4483|nr:hypothetical protein [Henriciella aquimarina]
MALLTGFLLVAVLGIAHHFGILCVRMCMPRLDGQTHRTVLTAFLGLLVLHTAEIVAWAAVYGVMLEGAWFGTLSGAYTGSFGDLIYFSGMNFVTLGFTQLKTDGAIRIISMMQSLGGFMILTWSATFIYSVWQDAVKKRSQE